MLLPLPGGQISTNDILAVFNKLKRRKAPGPDLVTYEHLIFGGDFLNLCLIKLFNAIVYIGKIPEFWKRGFIVPLYKGGDKPKTSCNSYRPVALLSCFLKVFENVINSRISEFVIDRHFPCGQQQGFQKHLGCLTASFNMQETIYHNVEQGSNIYVCFLDISKAFDTVWRHGLLIKLREMGISGKLWSIINDCHTNTTSAIVVNQTQSDWFPVSQGVRQGGVLSTYLFLVYINELVVNLEKSCTNTGIFSITSNFPSLADDISCIAITPTTLQRMLDVSSEYSRKWRFSFNAQKSCILQVRSKGSKLDFDYIWKLGDTIIPCGDNYTL